MARLINQTSPTRSIFEFACKWIPFGGETPIKNRHTFQGKDIS